MKFKIPDFTKLTFDSPKVRKKVYIASLLLFSLFVSSTFLMNAAFAAVSEGCGLFDVKLECDLSGWMKLFLGDIAVGAALALFLHTLAHRTSLKLEANGKEIQKILDAQEAVRKARRDYAVQNLKNHLTTLLFVLGIMNRLTINYNSATEQKSVLYTKIKGEEERMARILQNARNTIVYSSDTLDPTLVNQLDGVCTFVAQSTIKEKDGMLELDKYEKSRRKIDEISKKLASITESSPVFT
ncbi:MAG: hypothetical protein O6761_05025 [Thaumarchaeota archaeon]|nr:hypothetical protein [Nitrososphaerota archaeon]